MYLPSPHPERLVRVMDVFYYLGQHWSWKSQLFLFLFPAEGPSQGAPCVVLQQQPVHQIMGCIFAPLFCCRRGPAASTPFSPWAGKWLSLLHLPAPLGDWRMKLCSWDLNIQFATRNLCRVIPSWSSSAWSTWNTSTNRSCHVKNEMEGDSNCGLYN